MNVLWIVAGVWIAVVLAPWLTRHAPGGTADREFVSDRWIAEQRVPDLHDHGWK